MNKIRALKMRAETLWRVSNAPTSFARSVPDVLPLATFSLRLRRKKSELSNSFEDSDSDFSNQL